MPCDFQYRELPRVERRKLIDRVIDRLEKLISTGDVELKLGPQGAIVFKGWQKSDREGMTDVCAFRHLYTGKKSPVLRKAIAKAERAAGRKLSMTAVRAGVHSHDGGATWGSHR